MMIIKKIFTNKNFIYFLLILFGTIQLFQPPADPDFGWHFKYGEYLFQNGRLLKENIFSYTNTDYKWSNSYWIPQIFIYTTHTFLGSVFPTLILSIILSWIILYIISNQTKGLKNITINYTLIIISISAYVLTVRPLYFSTIFMFLLIYILIYKKTFQKFIPIIFLIWANTHADFVIALFILGIYCLYSFANIIGFPDIILWKSYLIGKIKKNKNINNNPWKILFKNIKNERNIYKHFFESFRILFISLIVTLANPYGFNLWLTLIKEFNQPVVSLVGEWQAPNISLKQPYIVYYSVLLGAGLLSGIKNYKEKGGRFGNWYKFLTVFFYILSVTSIYFGRVFFILTSFSLIYSFESIIVMSTNIIRILNRRVVNTMFTFTLIFIIISLLPTFLHRVSISSEISSWSKESKYPHDAITYIKNNPIEGRMMNIYDWGGYLIWQLPEYKTFVDGRMTAWRDGEKYFVKDVFNMYHRPNENKGLIYSYIDDYEITWLLDKPNSKLATYFKNLEENPWVTLYEDDISIILKKP